MEVKFAVLEKLVSSYLGTSYSSLVPSLPSLMPIMSILSYDQARTCSCVQSFLEKENVVKLIFYLINNIRDILIHVRLWLVGIVERMGCWIRFPSGWLDNLTLFFYFFFPGFVVLDKLFDYDRRYYLFTWLTRVWKILLLLVFQICSKLMWCIITYVYWWSGFLTNLFIFQYLNHRKKQEAEEKRMKQKKAREDFKKMLEVCSICFHISL